VERYYRDAPLMVIGEGTNEIQQLASRAARWRGPVARETVVTRTTGTTVGRSRT
jgi:hypothetical protein